MQSNISLGFRSRLVLRISKPSVTAIGHAGRLGFIKPDTPKLGGKLFSSDFPAIFISTDKHTAARPEISNAST